LQSACTSATIAGLMSEVRKYKTHEHEGIVEMGCQACEGRLPADRRAIVVLDGLTYCSDPCSEKHEPPPEGEVSARTDESDG
jgi:hypothetical protein